MRPLRFGALFLAVAAPAVCQTAPPGPTPVSGYTERVLSDSVPPEVCAAFQAARHFHNAFYYRTDGGRVGVECDLNAYHGCVAFGWSRRKYARLGPRDSDPSSHRLTVPRKLLRVKLGITLECGAH